jgi:hypothetical protein
MDACDDDFIFLKQITQVRKKWSYIYSLINWKKASQMKGSMIISST